MSNDRHGVWNQQSIECLSESHHYHHNERKRGKKQNSEQCEHLTTDPQNHHKPNILYYRPTSCCNYEKPHWNIGISTGDLKPTGSVKFVNTLPAKIWNIFYFSNFLHICGVCRVFLYLKYIATSRYHFLGSQLAFNSKMKRKGSKPIISALCSIRLWLEFLLFLYQIAAISIRVLYKDMVHKTIIYSPPILVRSAGD